jgi:Membrane bound beta barrel domain (DUF5777)
MLISVPAVMAQDEEKKQDDSGKKPARAAFESAQLMELQSVVVPSAKTLEMNMQHRFGLVDNGLTDLYGIYGPANIRIGFSYTVINNLAIGFGYTKFKKYVDLNIKYAILKQRKDWSIPVSITYFGNVALDTRGSENIEKEVHRNSYYHELNIASRLSSRLSLQVTPSFSHFNAVDSLYKNDIIGIAISGRFKFSSASSILFNFIQQVNTHNDPNFNLQPGIAIGLEAATSGHAFQIIFTSFQGIVPQENLAYNTNNFTKGKFMVGFNITRLWSF